METNHSMQKDADISRQVIDLDSPEYSNDISIDLEDEDLDQLLNQEQEKHSSETEGPFRQ